MSESAFTQSRRGQAALSQEALEGLPACLHVQREGVPTGTTNIPVSTSSSLSILSRFLLRLASLADSCETSACAKRAVASDSLSNSDAARAISSPFTHSRRARYSLWPPGALILRSQALDKTTELHLWQSGARPTNLRERGRRKVRSAHRLLHRRSCSAASLSWRIFVSTWRIYAMLWHIFVKYMPQKRQLPLETCLPCHLVARSKARQGKQIRVGGRHCPDGSLDTPPFHTSTRAFVLSSNRWCPTISLSKQPEIDPCTPSCDISARLRVCLLACLLA